MGSNGQCLVSGKNSIDVVSDAGTDGGDDDGDGDRDSCKGSSHPLDTHNGRHCAHPLIPTNSG